jgi:hypothetical protein
MTPFGGGAFSLNDFDASMLFVDSAFAASGGLPNGDPWKWRRVPTRKIGVTNLGQPK